MFKLRSFAVAAGALMAATMHGRAATVVPAHDPPDIPFRRAPMGLSSRSIVVSLATNVHLAFDARLLRTHAVWDGEPLNLYGPPFSGTATRFICDYSGTRLWGNQPARLPWVSGGAAAAPVGEPGSRAQYRGVSTKGGTTTFIYDVGSDPDHFVRVHETPRLERILGKDVVVRRYEMAGTRESLRLWPQEETGELVILSGEFPLPVTRRSNDFLVTVARGLPRGSLRATTSETAEQVLLEAEKGGKGPYSVVVTNTVTGRRVLLSVELPPHQDALAFELATVVCQDQAGAETMAKLIAQPAVKPARMAFLTSKEQDKAAVASPVLLPDSGFVDKPAADDTFIVEHFPVPKGIQLMAGGLDFLPNGDLAIGTYGGEVWVVEGAQGRPDQARWRRFARGLNEPGGLRVFDGQIYVAQKCELTRLLDTDGNGAADLFECLSDGWGYTGNYHSFATGPARDAAGNFYVMLTGHRTIHEVPFMGWCMKISREAGRGPGSDALAFAHRFTTEGFCSGLRVPNGFGEFDGEPFMADNQGHWIPANKLNHLQPGKFFGHPSAKPAPLAQFNGDPHFTHPAIWFPYAWVRSASGLATIAGDRFGPFKGQMLVGEFQNASVVRVALEKVNGQWQGAVFPFVKGFASGVNRIAFGPDGKLYAGGLRMGHWTSIAPQPHSLDRVSFTGRVPFEIKAVYAQPDGFELSFTQPVDGASAGDAENWDAAQYTYGYEGRHNAPENDREGKIPGPPVRVTKAQVSADKLRLRLRVGGCQPGHVIQLRALEVVSATGQKMRYDTCHYTLNQIPR